MVGMDTGGTAAPRVLVVDEDADVLASLERGLRLSGFEVSTAVDGAEALRSATETRPDAIVLDINIAVLAGVSVVTPLRPGRAGCPGQSAASPSRRHSIVLVGNHHGRAAGGGHTRPTRPGQRRRR